MLPPQEKYQNGVRYLDGGMPKQATELLEEAIAAGYAFGEVWFHWLLALLSYRTFRQISEEDLVRLRAARGQIPVSDDNEWARGIKLIFRLLDSLKTPEGDFRMLLQEFDELKAQQRDKVLRHLDLILKGPLENELWRRAIDRVEIERTANDRKSRVWMFFQPKPARPRARSPMPVATTLTQRVAALTAGIVFSVAAGYTGWMVAQTGAPSALVAYLVSGVGGFFCATCGLEWRFRVKRLRTKESEFWTPPPRNGGGSTGGFAKEVDKMFLRYARRYVPDGVNRSDWLADTAGIRRSVRDELVESYRETRVSPEAIAWLIRYEMSDIKRRWAAGTLLVHRYRFRTRASTKLVVVLGLAALVVGGIWAVVGIALERPLSAAGAAVVLLASGFAAARGWLHIVIEQRRFVAEQTESEQRLAGRVAAYERWCRKLERKPSDSEMAAWLDCDRKLLMDRVMQHYKLTADAVIAYAFLEAPAEGSRKRARMRNGPWRYSRYRLLVFLLTRDGVRQASADLDFEIMVFNDWVRTNYRYDAVAAVYVTESSDHPRTFELTLVNGEKVEVRVAESGAEQLRRGEDSKTLSEVAIDASGLTNTLHILEGVAADGKDWLRHEVEREEGRITAFVSMVSDLSD